MILSDQDIRARLGLHMPRSYRGRGEGAVEALVEGLELKIEPLKNPDLQIQPASVDMHLSPQFRCYRQTDTTFLDPRDSETIEKNTYPVDVGEDGFFVLHPGSFVLACTEEKVTIPSDLVGQVDGRSSIGRLGVAVHVTAGFIDPGFEGRITLELANLGRLAVKLYAGMRLCQLVLYQLSSPAKRPYGHPDRKSKYQGSMGPEASRVAKDW